MNVGTMTATATSQGLTAGRAGSGGRARLAIAGPFHFEAEGFGRCSSWSRLPAPGPWGGSLTNT